MIRQIMIAAAAIGALLLTGCASIVNGHNESVSIVTKNKGEKVDGAKCSLTNDKGVWYVTSPGSVDVHRSYGELNVSCAMTGLPNGTAAVKSSTTGAVFGNILVGGAIGAGVDIATGAAYNYPNLIPIDMGENRRIESAPPASPQAAPLPPDPALASTKVPYLNDARQAEYQTFLTKPLPRAFAISDNGHFASTWGTTTRDRGQPADPKERALARCREFAGKDCMLYVVDNQIVYHAAASTP